MRPNVGARQSRSFAKITCGLRASAQSDLFIIGPDAPGQHRFPRYRRLRISCFWPLRYWPCGGWLALCANTVRSEEHTSELQSLTNLVCRLLLEKKKNIR